MRNSPETVPFSIAAGGDKTPSVLVVGNFLSGNTVGTRGICEDLAERLVASGWLVLSTSRQRRRLVRIGDMVRTTWARRRQYDVAQVDVYSGNAFAWAEAVCWTLRRARKPYVLTLRGGDLPGLAGRWPRRMRRLLHSAAEVTVPSGYLLEQMRPYRSDLCLLPNPLDLSAYRHRLRERAGPRLVWLRAFHAIYNPSIAPQVVGLLLREFPAIRLTMLGPDKGDGSLERTQRAALRLALPDRIRFPGAVSKAEVAASLNHADIFLNTANVDNTPVSVLEAMACGLCVVSTNVGGIPYLLEHEHDALLVSPADPGAAANAVWRILTEPGLAQRLSANARRKVQAFDWSRILPQWEELLTDVGNGRRS